MFVPETIFRRSIRLKQLDSRRIQLVGRSSLIQTKLTETDVELFMNVTRLMQSWTFRLIFGVNPSTFCQPFVSEVAGTCVQLLSTRRPRGNQLGQEKRRQCLRTFVVPFLLTQVN